MSKAIPAIKTREYGTTKGPWTPFEDDTARELVARGYSYKQAGMCVGRTAAQVREHLRIRYPRKKDEPVVLSDGQRCDIFEEARLCHDMGCTAEQTIDACARVANVPPELVREKLPNILKEVLLERQMRACQ